MARFAYFADLPNGTVLEFRDRREPTYVGRDGIQRYREVPAKVGMVIQTYPTFGTGNVLCGYVPEKGWTCITRKVAMKDAPSRHDCDARCYNATGRTMNCECACGGKNHGRGRFLCEAA